MKNLIIILLLALGVSSCSQPTIRDADSNTEIPTKVYMDLQDSTKIEYDTAILEGESKLYLVNQDKEGKAVITRYLDKEDEDTLYIFGIISFFIVGFAFGSLRSD